jgi:hypothetical protein
VRADPSTGLFILSFTDMKQKRYKATMSHFLQYCRGGETLHLGRGAGRQEVLVSYTAREAAVRALEENRGSQEFPGIRVVEACSEEG